MQASLAFLFPHNQKQVPIRIFVPQPDLRPRTVANLIYMCTGELPPPEMLAALRLPPTDIAFASSDAARAAGLKCFAETAVIRVEKGVMLELGSSTSRSIFGGFLPDERPDITTTGTGTVVASGATLRATLHLLRAGTVVCGNVGMPNTNASRYYIMLADVKDKDRAEYASYTPLGMVTGGLEQLVASANSLPVQPRSLEPLKRVALTACLVEFDFSHLGANNSYYCNDDSNSSGGGGGGLRERSDRDRNIPRTSGRVRRRDEDKEEEEEAEKEAEGADGGGGGGFFHFDARYPVSGGRKGAAAGKAAAAAALGPAAKRRRGETLEFDEYGYPILRNTATLIDDDDAVVVNGVRTKRKKNFSYFDAQEEAFLNDIDLIKETQTKRTHNKMRRLGKQSAGKGFGMQSSKRICERVLRIKESKGKARAAKPARRTTGSSSSSSSGSGGGRKLNKRY